MIGNTTPLVSVWLRGNFHAELCTENGTQQAIPNGAWAGSYARVLLKYLLCAPSRRATRSDLIDELWPGDHEKADQYLSVAASKLRAIFQNKEIIRRQALGYELAGPAVLWCDIEEDERFLLEAERLMRAAERREPAWDRAICLLERVSRSFERGELLEGEAGEWCAPLRTSQEKATRSCHILLAKGYESQDMILHAQRQYQRLFDSNPIDEDALCRLLGLLHRQGMIDDLRSAYEQAQKRFKQYEMQLSQTSGKLFEKLMQESPPFEVYLAPPVLWSRPKESEALWWRDTSLARPSPITYNRSSQLSTLPLLEKLELLMLSRRRALSDILKFASSSLLLSPNALFPQEGRQQLERAMRHSSYLDEKAIGHLAAITQNYWDMRETTAAIGLVDGITGHFLDITRFLKESRPTHIYKKLGALASFAAQLLARTFDEMREYDLAWDCYGFALHMAQEINHNDLWASAAVRLAELIMEWGDPLEALPFLHAAQKRGISDQRLRVWVSATEARIYARTGNMDAFLRALEHSKKITLPEPLAHDPYRTDVDSLTVVRDEGACLMWLHKPESALLVLNHLSSHDPISTLRSSYRLADLGRVHGQLGDVKNACKLLLESLDITAQTKSLIRLQHVYQGRAELDPWKESGEVKELDARIVEVYNSFVKVRESV